MDAPALTPSRQKFLSILLIFLRLGTIAFGGPAAHVAIMQEEFVRRRKWLSDQQFLDLLGATNLIPGPNSTEMAIHLGYLHGGTVGLIAAGIGFIVPAMTMMLGLAWLYVRYQSLPEAGWLLYGIKPVIIVIILQALWNLGRKAVKSTLTALTGLAALVLYLAGANELAILFGGGLLVMVLMNLHQLKRLRLPAVLLPLAGLGLPAAAAPFSLSLLFLSFLRIGAVLYGSGYVLLAFLRADFVVKLGWLNDQQLIDAIAMGQVTPGPVFTSATFIGYLLGDVPGALLATAGIFLPSFFFVAISNPWVPRLRQSPWAGALLDGVNVVSLGLMAGVTGQLARASLVDWGTVLVALVSAVLLFRFKPNPTWLILGGALFGLLHLWLA